MAPPLLERNDSGRIAYAGSLARTLRKEPKIYFWDWAEAPEGGARFENLVPSHLLKLCHWLRPMATDQPSIDELDRSRQSLMQ